MPDAEINGVKTEYRVLTGRSLSLALHAKADLRQAKHVVFDVRQSGMTLAEALLEINTDREQRKKHPPRTAEESQAKFHSITLIGKDFEVTIIPK